MAGQDNARAVVIKRKKIVAGGGHHGGAWKVAYADFVTAMMAFFMLMWLLNATTEKQRKGLADYFNPTIPVNRISGGGDGAMGGDSVMTEDTKAQNGAGASSVSPTEKDRARGSEESTPQEGSEGEAQNAETAMLQDVAEKLVARSGESMTMERALRHVATRVTDEGLVIEIFDLPEGALFDGDTATAMPVLGDIARLLAEVLVVTANPLAVAGHVRAYPITLIDHPGWSLSTARAQAMRSLLQDTGFPAARLSRVSGHSDRKPVTPDPTAIRNNRLEVILLRRDR